MADDSLPIPSHVKLRTFRPGDLSWLVSRQTVLYHQEYGWDIGYEALTSEIVCQFIRNYDPEREQCWIAELDGQPVGGVMIVKVSNDIAKLRLLHVEKASRGMGIGQRLVEACIQFSRQAGYQMITLWTQNNLLAARMLYHRFGFRIVHQEQNDCFGRSGIAETWELRLNIHPRP